MSQQRKTAPLNRDRGTASLGNNDLGLLATVIVLQGRRFLQARSPATLARVEKLAANPGLRDAALGLINGVEKGALAMHGLKAKAEDGIVAAVRLLISLPARVLRRGR